MTLLHELFDKRNIQGFQRLLDASIDRRVSMAGSSSSSPASSKSWNRSGGFVSVDVNARDSLGRTALHLASSSLESIEYVRALLKHPNIDLNIMDWESHWTALHRALYSANLPAALLLLQRSDIDISVKDLEGYTAFDLYNSTVNDTKPQSYDAKPDLEAENALLESELREAREKIRNLDLFIFIEQPDLEAENARLQSELREARKKIRNLELQVETIRANARKAAQACKAAQALLSE